MEVFSITVNVFPVTFGKFNTSLLKNIDLTDPKLFKGSVQVSLLVVKSESVVWDWWILFWSSPSVLWVMFAIWYDVKLYQVSVRAWEQWCAAAEAPAAALNIRIWICFYYWRYIRSVIISSVTANVYPYLSLVIKTAGDFFFFIVVVALCGF